VRIRIVVIGLALVVVGAATLFQRTTGDPPAGLPRSSALLVGDSLNLGVEQYLRDELRGWQLDVDDEVGRSTTAGLERLSARGSGVAPYLVVSLGTNDPSTGVEAFRGDVAELLRLAGSGRCVVWVAISRDGDAYEPFNAVLREAASSAPNLHVVDWPALVRGHPAYLASDGVHATPDGYRARARAIVAAMRACPVRQ
jgi:GDSL-like Lipase/Acylhydrolase family